jgi:hypothetical protein
MDWYPGAPYPRAGYLTPRCKRGYLRARGWSWRCPVLHERALREAIEQSYVLRTFLAARGIAPPPGPPLVLAYPSWVRPEDVG